MTIIKENAPHLRKKETVTRMMVDVLIALSPTLLFSFIVYPIRTLIFYVISLSIIMCSELAYIGLTNMMPKDDIKHTFKEKLIYAYKGKIKINNFLSGAITAVIFVLIMPAGAPIYAVIIGSLVGIVLGKLVFGGLGSNIFNPAAVGMLFAKICFGSQFKNNVDSWYYTVPDAISGSTPLGLINNGNLSNIYQFSLFDLFFGLVPGTLGEVYKITIIIGLIYLLIRRSADYRIVVSYLGSFILFMLVAGLTLFAINKDINPFTFILYNLLSGGVIFGATFMLTDPVTSPINSPSRYFYGIIASIFTVFIRLFAALPEGMGFSILIANMFAVVLDHYEWSSPIFTRKKFRIITMLLIIPSIIIIFVLRYGGVYNG